MFALSCRHGRGGGGGHGRRRVRPAPGRHRRAETGAVCCSCCCCGCRAALLLALRCPAAALRRLRSFPAMFRLAIAKQLALCRVSAQGRSMSLESLLEWCKPRLSAEKRPRRYCGVCVLFGLLHCRAFDEIAVLHAPVVFSGCMHCDCFDLPEFPGPRSECNALLPVACRLLVLKEIPRNAVGKVNKKQLVKLFD